MYLGAASGTTVSHVSDIVGPVSTFFFPKSVFFSVYNLHLHIRCIHVDQNAYMASGFFVVKSDFERLV